MAGGYWRVLLPGALLFTLLRVPSFFEPHWYTDEAGYATTARALLEGKALYAQAWTNKPPLQVWTVAVVLRLFGPTEWALHGLTWVAGVLALAALAYAASRLLPPVAALVATLVGAVLLGAPLLGTELSIPENLLIAPTGWAGALLLTRVDRGGRGWPVAVGALTAAAIAYQQTAVADAAAFGAIILLAAPRPRRALPVYLATLVVGTVAWLVPALVVGGISRVAFALVGFYIPFTGSVLPHTGGGLLLLGVLLLAATASALLGAYLLRHHPVVTWAAWFWAVATGLVAGAAHQPYAHYLIPAIVPFALALGSLSLSFRVPRRLRAGVGVAAITAAVVIASVLASVVADDWMLYEFWVGPYYRGFAGVVAGRQPLAGWQDSFDNRVASDEAVTAWIRAHHLEGARTVIWSGDTWPYLTADLPLLLPTAPIYNDEVLMGEGGPVATRVARLHPEVIVTVAYATQMFPEIDPVLRRHYHLVLRSGVDSVWLRDGATPASGP